MNAGVALVQAYLHLNGYFTTVEFPVIRRAKRGEYREVTDIDVLGVRFPGARHAVPQGRPGPEDDFRFPVDPKLDLPRDAMDVIIAEVKEGKARLNDALRTAEVLGIALERVGCCPPSQRERVIGDLLQAGTAWVDEGGAIRCRVRLIAFGDGGGGGPFTVVHLGQAARFVREHLSRYHEVLHPADIGDPVLGLLHLLEKLG